MKNKILAGRMVVKFIVGFICLYFGFLSLSGPAGFPDKTHYFLAPLSGLAAVFVSLDLFKAFRLHLVWFLISAVIAQQGYRYYENARWMADSYREEVERMQKALMERAAPVGP